MNYQPAHAAEHIYLRAGYDQSQAARHGQVVANYLSAHLDEVRSQFNIQDEYELARLLALAMVRRS